MSLEQTKNLIADQLYTIADSIRDLENTPSRLEASVIVGQMYHVQRQMSAWAEANGYGPMLKKEETKTQQEVDHGQSN